MRYFYRRDRRLHREGEVEPLFRRGSSVFIYPLKVMYAMREVAEGAPSWRAVIIVPKRNLKKATARNLVRRRIREALRLHQYDLRLDRGQQLHLGLVYVSHEVCGYDLLERSVVEMYARLSAGDAAGGENAPCAG